MPLTVPEVRRLLWQWRWQKQAAPEAVFAWSNWRRRHQRRAQIYHDQRRQAPSP